MDGPLRTKLWSALHLAVFEPGDSGLRHINIDARLMIQRLWLHFFEQPLDKLPTFAGFTAYVRRWFFAAKWYEVYDFIEAALAELRDQKPFRDLTTLANSYLESELSAYRIIDGIVTEITTSEEIASIEEALTKTGGMESVRAHLRDALAKLSDRREPDYRNSVKESISAVEAMCRLITGEETATLGQAIKRLRDSGVTLHRSLEGAWLRLYGYTSDEGGVRHALTGESQVGFPEAKYMLVSCTAFINYLLELARLGGIALDPDR